MNETVTLTTLRRLKQQGAKIACVTSYDASFTPLLERAGVEVVHAAPAASVRIHRPVAGEDDVEEPGAVGAAFGVAVVEHTPAVLVRLVSQKGGAIIILIDVPVSFQISSLFDPMTLKTYSPPRRFV